MIAKQPYSGGVFPRTNTLQVVVSFFNSPTRSLRRYSLRLPAKEIRMVSWALRSLLSVAGIEGDNWFVGDTYRCIIGGFIGIQRVLLGQSLGYHGNIPSGNVAGKSPKYCFFMGNRLWRDGLPLLTMHVWSPEGMYISYWFILIIPLCILDHPYTKICNWYLTALSAHDVIVIGCGWSQNNVLPMSNHKW